MILTISNGREYLGKWRVGGGAVVKACDGLESYDSYDLASLFGELLL